MPCPRTCRPSGASEPSRSWRRGSSLPDDCLFCRLYREGEHVARTDGFVALRDVDPTIRYDIRYFGRHNFVGDRIDGYRQPQCVLTRAAATAMRSAQRTLLRQGYTLKVYDCYRPQRAVDNLAVVVQRRVDRQQVRQEAAAAHRVGHLDADRGALLRAVPEVVVGPVVDPRRVLRAWEALETTGRPRPNASIRAASRSSVSSRTPRFQPIPQPATR